MARKPVGVPLHVAQQHNTTVYIRMKTRQGWAISIHGDREEDPEAEEGQPK